VTYRSFLRRIVTRSRRPRRGAPPFAIFLYHAVVERQLEIGDFCFIRQEEFRRQVDALRRRFRLIPLEEGARLLAAGELTEPAAAITFDDGFQDNFDVAYPILREAGAPATIFVCTDLLDTDRVLWYCRLHDAITRTGARELEWEGRRYPLDSAATRYRAANELKNDLKRLRPPDLESAVDEIAARLVGRARGGPGVASDRRFRMLSRAAIRSMAQEGLVDFGAHTGSHAILAKLERAEQRHEIERSVREVSALVGKPCRTFAYPNGRFEDYDSATIDLLRRVGVTVAVTAEKGLNDRDTPGLELLRLAIGGEPSMPSFDQALARYDRALRASS